MSGYGPDQDPSEAPTGQYDYEGEQGQPLRNRVWYRRPIVWLAIILFLAMLLGVGLYVLADQTRGGGNTTQTPTSPTTPTGTGTPTTAAPTSAPVAPAPTTTMTFPPTTTTEPSTTTPITASPTSTTTDDDHHHHHHHGDGETP